MTTITDKAAPRQTVVAPEIATLAPVRTRPARQLHRNLANQMKRLTITTMLIAVAPKVSLLLRA